MSEQSSASVGGSGGATGVGLQDHVFAWAAAAMIAEQPLLGELLAGPVVRVGAQTGHELDDVVVQSTLDNYALFQVKARLQLSAAPDSPLAKALAQAVEQYLVGRLRSPDGTERSIDPLRDALVLCTDSSAPATIHQDLGAAIKRVASHPPGTPLDHELAAKERKALGVVLAHVRRMWVDAGQPEPDDEALRGFLRALRVLVLATREGQHDQTAAVATMSTSAMTADQTRTAWPLVVDQAHRASEDRRWLDRTAVARALANHGIYLSPPSKHVADIEKLHDLSTANLRAMETEAQLPIANGIFIERTTGERALADDSGKNLLITGDAGTGKSAVAQQLARARAATHTVILLRASDVAGVNRVHLSSPLGVVLTACTGPTGVLVVDGVDALRGAEDREILSALVEELRASRWQVVATARRFDARNNVRLQQAFRGSPLSDDPTQVDANLTTVRHLLVDDLTEEELEVGLGASAVLQSIVAAAQNDLRVLLRNPFNLRLAAQLAPELPIDELLSVRSRLELLTTYWKWRVVDDDRTARQALVKRLCERMISSRRLEVEEAEPSIIAADSPSVAALLSANVISASSRFGDAAPRVLLFSHNILFDYAAAIYVLLDPIEPRKLLSKLDGDPSLPLVARPSMEILVDLLWGPLDRRMFWAVLLDLSASRHELTSLAFAGRLITLIRDPMDLDQLAPDRNRPDSPNGFTPEQKIIRQLVGALRTRAVVVVTEHAARPLANLARRLAENADSTVDLALSIDLLRALQSRWGDVIEEDDRTRALAALLDGCRTEPVAREALAEGVCRLVPGMIGQSSEVRAAVIRLLDHREAIDQWGGTVLTWLAEAVGAVSGTDRDLARRLASTVLTFRESRDEQVSFLGSSLLPLNESRVQQAQHGVYRLGRSFPQLCAEDLDLAALIFCDLAPAREGEPSVRWSVTVPGAAGSLSYGPHLVVSIHGVGETAARALASALAGAEVSDARAVVATLVANLRNAFAWAALMTPASEDDAKALGLAFLPALASGALLAHPATQAAAAGLLGHLADVEPALHGELEEAVLNAHILLDDEATNDDHTDAGESIQRAKDALLGCLRPEATASPELVARLAHIGPRRPPRIEPSVTMTATVTPFTLMDQLSAEGVELRPETESIASRLSQELTFARNSADTRPDVERRLPDLFVEADRTFQRDGNLPASARQLWVDAAEALAHDRRVDHASTLGRRVVELLASAAEQRESGSFLHSERAWSPGLRDRGVSGLATLLRRPDWSDAEARPLIEHLVQDALTDPNPLVRMLAAEAARALHADSEATARTAFIADLLRAETDDRVRYVLVDQLRPDVAHAPDCVASTIDQLLGEQGGEAVDPGSNLGRTLLALLTYLALVVGTSSAVRRVEQWCDDAVTSSAWVEGFARYARDYIHSPDPAPQEATFRLLSTAVGVVRTHWERSDVLAGALSGEDRLQMEAAARVAYTVAEQVYFASGAMDDLTDGEPGVERGDFARFADLAFPILISSAALGVPQCVHEAVQTMVFLAPADEARALTAIAGAVPSGTLYSGDSLAGGVVMPYLRRLLTEHRDLALYDNDGSTAFQRLLEVFAGAGNQEALELAYTFADIFR